MDNKFQLGKKWFCIGIAAGFFSVFAGLIYGIALILEKEYRKEGALIIAFSIIWKILLLFFIMPYFVKKFDFWPMIIGIGIK